MHISLMLVLNLYLDLDLLKKVRLEIKTCTFFTKPQVYVK